MSDHHLQYLRSALNLSYASDDEVCDHVLNEIKKLKKEIQALQKENVFLKSGDLAKRYEHLKRWSEHAQEDLNTYGEHFRDPTIPRFNGG